MKNEYFSAGSVCILPDPSKSPDGCYSFQKQPPGYSRLKSVELFHFHFFSIEIYTGLQGLLQLILLTKTTSKYKSNNQGLNPATEALHVVHPRVVL